MVIDEADFKLQKAQVKIIEGGVLATLSFEHSL